MSPGARARLTYFLRHLLIDLVPSLPFGFVAHQIDLAEIGDARRGGGRPGAMEWPGGYRPDGPGAADSAG